MNPTYADELKTLVGTSLGTSRWVTIDQERIDLFAAATDDPDPMHVDPEWCENHSPFGKCVAFGFLTMSMLTAFLHDVLGYDKESHAGTGGYALNYGFEKVRLVAPVPVDTRIRGHFTLLELLERRPGQHQLRVEVEVEVEGEERPALVAEWLGIWVTADGHGPIAHRARERA